jgi:hypothetical protein
MNGQGDRIKPCTDGGRDWNFVATIMLEPLELEEAGRILPRALRGRMAMPTSWVWDFYLPELRENTFL